LIDFERSAHRLVELQLIFEKVNSISQLNALGGGDVARVASINAKPLPGSPIR